MILEKKIRFNNKDWLVKTEDNYFEVFLYNEDGSINQDYSYQGCSSGKTLIDQCRNIIIQASGIKFPTDELDDFQKWNGNMDEELNIK